MKKALTLLIVVFALVTVPVASAGSSVLNGYGTSGSAPVVQVKGSTGSNTPTTSSSGPSQLPFTGADLIVFIAAGTALMGVGFGLRRLAREKE